MISSCRCCGVGRRPHIHRFVLESGGRDDDLLQVTAKLKAERKNERACAVVLLLFAAAIAAMSGSPSAFRTGVNLKALPCTGVNHGSKNSSANVRRGEHGPRALLTCRNVKIFEGIQ